MARTTREEKLSDQLTKLLRMAGASPRGWVSSTIAVSVILAALDTLGIAAMVPLTQLIGGAPTDTGALGVISDIAGTSSPTVLIPLIAGAITILFIVKSVAALGFRWWLLGRTTRVSAMVASELLGRYALAPYADHRSRRLSEIYRNVGDATQQGTSVLLATVSMVTDVLMLAAIVTVLAIAAPVVTLITVVLFAVFMLGLQWLLRGRQARLGEEIAAASLQAWQFLLPGLDGFREARLTSSASGFVDGFMRARLRGARVGREMGIITELPRYGLEIGFIIAIVGISLYLFATGTPADALTVLGLFSAAALRALPTLNRVAANLATIRTGRVGLRIVLAAADELDAGGRHEETPRTSDRFVGDLVIDDVEFTYPDSDTPVLRGVSITIPQNRTVAFVGSSGAGKSTLLDLVLGLLEPTRGTITCGGRSISQDKAGWYTELSVVPQDVFLLNDSVWANVAFGVAEDAVDRERVHEVLAMARLSDVVSDLPDGLDTVVGERGVRLSGGQRQRLGLARALYRRPTVLVLDEATSALDNATEQEIAATLAKLAGSMTIIVVAHRLSTVRGADTLIFLKDGLVEATGTFSEVREQSEDFAHLVELGELR
jgi:ABC-type multidrug transport system fused ATPase/permease subunit